VAGEVSRGVVRAATFDDAEEATRVLREVGLRMPQAGTESLSHWDRLWRRNPAVADAIAPPSLGWVLEDDGRMVGFFGNVPLHYYLGDQRVVVGDASQWGVQPAYRGETDRLCQAYFSQPNVDMLLVTTGIRPTGRIFERYGGSRLPQPHYDQISYWIVDTAGFIEAALRKKEFGPVTARWAARLTAPVVALSNMRKARPGAARTAVEMMAPAAIDEAFDGLWRRKRAEARRLLACRDSAWLRWHFADRPSASETSVIVTRGPALNGYAVAMRDDAPASGLRRLKVADILVAGDEPRIVHALMGGVLELARAQRCHVVEIFGVPSGLRAAIAELGPRSRLMPTWPAYYRATNPALAPELTHESNWYVTPYDGDTTLV
jgi:hypothetical protein